MWGLKMDERAWYCFHGQVSVVVALKPKIITMFFRQYTNITTNLHEVQIGRY
jgi:hypothetical protein